MAQKLIDVYRHILKYNKDIVYIAFHKITGDPFFHANQLCELLEYADCRDVIRRHVDENDIAYLKDIIENYKILYKNVQGHTKFLNEAATLLTAI
ncbi:MAG: BRO-N domain protein [Hyperionvirus sp.]|uniref:BRO-N domain protein n=1 Tax=Hyperionvirus sp. TaxID=2487770 RepID=A0A3G5AB56_9VIRU|nr:MAG: BRO-N domain protein [Hyperionvirus sp.]